MNKIAEKLLFEFLARTAPRTRGTRVVALCYHKVVPRGWEPAGVDRFTVFQEDFDKQLQAVRDAGFAIINPDQIAGCDQDAVVITFDDNLSTHLNFALPVLKQHGAQATFFLNPDLLNHDGQMVDSDVDLLCAAGMKVGAHNARHLIVAEMDLPAFAAAVQTCELFLDRYQMPKVWAYPGGYPGSFSQRHDEILKQSGFIRFTTLEGNCDRQDLTRPQSRYVLRINSSLNYVRAILEGRLQVLATLKKGRYAKAQRRAELASRAG